MKISFPQFIKITNFDKYEKQSLQTEVEELSSKYKSHNLLETKDTQTYQQQSFQQEINYKASSQLSFQKSFMNQHLQTFDFQLKILAESTLQQQSSCALNLFKQENHGAQCQFSQKYNSVKSYLKSGDCHLGAKESQILMEKLEIRQKLKQFLQQICKKSCCQIAIELIILAKFVLEEFQKIQNQELPYEKLLNLVKNMMEQYQQKITNNKIFQFLSFEKDKENQYVFLNQTKEKCSTKRKFLEYLIKTLFLVTSEYVSNPYYPEVIQNRLKRHLFFNNKSQDCEYDRFSSSQDDENEELFSHIKKKRK